AINGNLSLGGTLNVSNGGGLTNGAYTVITYGGSLSGTSPTLGNVPAGFKFSIDTNTVGQVKLVVAPPVNTAPTNLTFSAAGNVLEVNWPLDHTGWWLQMQTNDLSHGLGTNWITVPDSDMTNHMLIPIDATKGCTFLRLFFPAP
ncbi:MAG TPA: hypothetical protein VFF11_06775, partial [Candidatus Binatia bacterium]|nr:hypothetical protein [Candidatus Binatia bacterium]